MEKSNLHKDTQMTHTKIEQLYQSNKTLQNNEADI